MVYLMYFYFMFFAFCQTHNLATKQQHYASIIFAILIIILGIAYLVAISVLLIIRNNQGKLFIEGDDSNMQSFHNEYQSFVGNLRPKSTNIFGLMSQPIRYFEKLVISISFAYCSNY